MRIPGHAKVANVDVQKGPIVDSLNAKFNMKYCPIVPINYPMYGYLQRKNRVEIGTKYDGFKKVVNSVQIGRSFKYDKWSTQDFAQIDFEPFGDFRIIGNQVYS